MPSLNDALQNKNIISGLIQSWKNTQEKNYEYGGWILCSSDGTYGIRHTTDRIKDNIILTRPKDLAEITKFPGTTILSDFHCHPTKPGVISGRPSWGDIEGAKGLKYKRLVFTADHLDSLQRYFRSMPCPPPDGFPPRTVMWRVEYEKED